ncbi:MAG: SGNH/GDSL hydrolase family protein [Bacteroidota bacterium]
MKFNTKVLIILFFCVNFSIPAFSQSKLQPFKQGDRVVFAGNSITEAGLYESYIWLYYMTHYPTRKIEIFNAGIGGDVAGQIYARLDGDILKKKPSVLAVTFGMNDSKYFEYLDKNKPVDDLKRAEIVKEAFTSYQKIEERLKKLPGVSTILMASSPYDETAKLEGNLFLGKSKTMEHIIEFQRNSAKTNNWGFVDFFNPMTEINQREQKKNPAYTNTGTDRIHPGSAGHFIMAYIFLKSQGLAGSKIADVVIDAARLKVSKAGNSSITHLKRHYNSISFEYLAKSLPYPIDSVPRVWLNNQIQTEALSVIPFESEFNQELLTITGLPVGTYQVEIDEKTVGNWSSKELGVGINLATIKSSPQHLQSLKIMDLNNRRREVESKFRNYYWVEYDFLKDKGMLFSRNQASIDTVTKYAPHNGWLNAKKTDYLEIVNHEASVQAKHDDLVNEIYKVNKPITHRITISKKP